MVSWNIGLGKNWFNIRNSLTMCYNILIVTIS